MISKITFPKEGKGYLYAKPIESADIRTCREYHCADKNERKKLIEENKKEIRAYKKVKDVFTNNAYRYLAGKTFEFSADKINVVFGPNGSGKSTMIKAIAGSAFTSDGWCSLLNPMDYSLLNDKKGYDIKETIFKRACNECVLEWDGSPVYFHNFEEKRNKSYGILGGLVGSVLDNCPEEMLYHVEKSSWNSGLHAGIFLSKIFSKFETRKTMDDIVRPYKEKFKTFNDTWVNCWNTQIKYLESLSSGNENSPNTLIFDEVDGSFDILNTLTLFKKALPEFVKKYGVQVILVSHSPIVLMDDIYDSENYNIISVEPKYTEECRKMLNFSIA